MTNSPLTKTELAHAFTPDSADDAPVVDGLGNPRFLSALDFPHDSDPEYGLSVPDLAEVLDEWDAEAARAEAHMMRYGYA